MEEFTRSKLESSLRRAGASEHIARELTSQLAIREGLSTSELRSQVLSALRTKDAEAAERYERTRCCRANSSSKVTRDVVRLHPETLEHLGLSSGASLQLEHNGKAHSLRVEESPSVDCWRSPAAQRSPPLPRGFPWGKARSKESVGVVRSFSGLSVGPLPYGETQIGRTSRAWKGLKAIVQRAKSSRRR